MDMRYPSHPRQRFNPSEHQAKTSALCGGVLPLTHHVCVPLDHRSSPRPFSPTLSLFWCVFCTHFSSSLLHQRTGERRNHTTSLTARRTGGHEEPHAGESRAVFPAPPSFGRPVGGARTGYQGAREMGRSMRWQGSARRALATPTTRALRAPTTPWASDGRPASPALSPCTQGSTRYASRRCHTGNTYLWRRIRPHRGAANTDVWTCWSPGRLGRLPQARHVWHDRIRANNDQGVHDVCALAVPLDCSQCLRTNEKAYAGDK
jgi:hypothetical protein